MDLVSHITSVNSGRVMRGVGAHRHLKTRVQRVKPTRRAGGGGGVVRGLRVHGWLEKKYKGEKQRVCKEAQKLWSLLTGTLGLQVCGAEVAVCHGGVSSNIDLLARKTHRSIALSGREWWVVEVKTGNASIEDAKRQAALYRDMIVDGYGVDAAEVGAIVVVGRGTQKQPEWFKIH